MPPVAESFADLRFPTSGVDQTAAYQSQRPGTTRIGVNVRGFEPLSQRLRGGQRQGLSQYVPQQLPTGARVQNLNAVVSVSGLALPWSFDYSYLNLVDPSSPGSATDWPPGKVSRVPPLLLPTGGWPYQPNKNLPRPVKIVWTRPADISVGTALSGTQLNASAQDATNSNTISGSFTYTPAAGTQLPVGQAQPLAATFSSADPSSFQTNLTAANLINVVTASAQTIRFVQSKRATAPVTYDSAVGSGDLLVAFAYATGAGASTVTVSDSRGNTWNQVGGYLTLGSGASKVVLSLWYAVSKDAGTCTASVTAGWTLRLAEFSGTKSTPLVDSQTGTGGPPLSAGQACSTAAVNVTGTGQLLLGVFYDPNTPSTTWSSLAGFSDLWSSDFIDAGTYQINPSVAAQAVTMDLGNAGASSRFLAIGASFDHG